MVSWKIVIFAYLVAINILAFCMYGIDKWKARNHKWRISENALMLVAFFGGGVGAFCGMQCFRHKTKHLKFKICIPLFMILQIVMIIYCGFFL